MTIDLTRPSPGTSTPPRPIDPDAIEIGIDSFAAMMPDPATGRVPGTAERLALLLDEVVAADEAGLDVFGLGEHHRPEYADAAPAVILAAAAARTSHIRLTSAVSVLGATDPVRLFQDFATLDNLSGGRAEIVAGRGSFAEAFPLFGLSRDDYDALFAEKLHLLLRLREDAHPRWSGRFRAPLTGQGVFPRPVQPLLPVWVGVGGTPASFARAGALGLPLMVAIIGGSFARFRPLVDMYREAGRLAGHRPEVLRVGLHVTGFVAESDEEARAAFFPGWFDAMTRVGRERGWPPTSRAQFDAAVGPEGAFLVGSPATVATKAAVALESLGASRLALQMSSAAANPPALLRSIGLLGTAVAPLLRRAAPAAPLSAAARRA